MSRFFLIVSLFIQFAMVAVANDRAKALALLKGVEQERLKYNCFNIHYEEYRAESGLTLEQKVDFNRGQIRKEFIPNEVFLGKKSVLLEDVVYCMTSYTDKHVAIVTHESNNAYATGIYDPRSLGLTDMMNHRTKVSSGLLYAQRSNFSVSRDNLEGRSVFVVECQDGADNGFAHFKLYIEEPKFLLIKKTVESEFGKIQITNDYSERKFLPFPTKTHIHRIRANGEVIFDRHITVKDVQIKKSFPPETFTLAGLNPPLNSDVVDYRINRRLGYWDGEKLVDKPVSVSAKELRELMQPAKRGWTNYLFMGIGIVLILWALFRMKTKRQET